MAPSHFRDSMMLDFPPSRRREHGLIHLAARGSDEISHPTLVEIYRYWADKRRGRAMPNRADIDPTEISALLPHIFMVDVERDPLRFKYRLIGTAVVGLLGRDFTGRAVDITNYSEEHAAALRDIFMGVVDTGRPVGWKGNIFYVPGREWMPIESILLPLCMDGNGVKIIFAGFAATRPFKAAAPSSVPAFEGFRLILDPIIAGVTPRDPSAG
jgi:hypothetical protein